MQCRKNKKLTKKKLKMTSMQWWTSANKNWPRNSRLKQQKQQRYNNKVRKYLTCNLNRKLMVPVLISILRKADLQLKQHLKKKKTKKVVMVWKIWVLKKTNSKMLLKTFSKMKDNQKMLWKVLNRWSITYKRIFNKNKSLNKKFLNKWNLINRRLSCKRWWQTNKTRQMQIHKQHKHKNKLQINHHKQIPLATCLKILKKQWTNNPSRKKAKIKLVKKRLSTRISWICSKISQNN